MKAIGSRSTCPVGYTLDVFGDKWTLLLLRDMIFDGKNSWLEWRASAEQIAPSVLSDRVNLLMNEKYLIKKVSDSNASKFLYYLTDKGLDLIPLMVELMAFGCRYNPQGGSAYWMKKIESDKNKTISELQEKMLAARQEAFPSD
ncbi:winged helix-turn-helix transcriptional regulator [Spirosoma horti]